MATPAPVPTPAPPEPDPAAVAIATAAALADPAALQAFLSSNRDRLVAAGHIKPELLIQTT